jgi:enoyl-CoA hydratase/carnithine racemase
MSNVLVSRDGAILRIQLDRPEKKNALTAQMYAALADALHGADADPSVRVAVIHGNEAGFTAGNDLADFMSNPPGGMDAPVIRFLQAVSRAEKPLVAAVTGPAVGVGTTMLLHCEFVYAADTAKFALPFVNLGLCPEAGSSYLLPLAAGYRRAAELLLLGEPFDAATARECGIVTRVLPAAEVLDAAMATARKLAERPATSVLMTKQLMRRTLQSTIDSVVSEEAGHFLALMHSPAAKEAFAAFFEKRKPDFSKAG